MSDTDQILDNYDKGQIELNKLLSKHLDAYPADRIIGVIIKTISEDDIIKLMTYGEVSISITEDDITSILSDAQEIDGIN